jgi:hypothetical protein
VELAFDILAKNQKDAVKWVREFTKDLLFPEKIEVSNMYREAWADFVWELRRNGYWEDPEKYRQFFLGYFNSYFEGGDRSLTWHLSHCCDGIDGEDFQGHYGFEWTEDEKKQAEEEWKKLLAFKVTDLSKPNLTFRVRK